VLVAGAVMRTPSGSRSASGGGVEREISFAPLGHRLQHCPEALATLSQLVDDPGRHLGVDGAGEHALILEDAQALGEGFRAADRQRGTQLAEALWAAEQLAC